MPKCHKMPKCLHFGSKKKLFFLQTALSREQWVFSWRFLHALNCKPTFEQVTPSRISGKKGKCLGADPPPIHIWMCGLLKKMNVWTASIEDFVACWIWAKSVEFPLYFVSSISWCGESESGRSIHPAAAVEHLFIIHRGGSPVIGRQAQ